MKRALRYPSRWAGWWRTLGITAVLSVALGACLHCLLAPVKAPSNIPAPAPVPNAVVDLCREGQGHGRKPCRSATACRSRPSSTATSWGLALSAQAPASFIELLDARSSCPTMPGGPGGRRPPPLNATAPGPVKRESLPPPPTKGEPPAPPRRPAAAGQPTPLGPAAAKIGVSVPATPPPPRLPGRSRARSWPPTAPPPVARSRTASTSRPHGRAVKAAEAARWSIPAATWPISATCC